MSPTIQQSICPFCFDDEIFSTDSITWVCLECKIRIKHGAIIERNIEVDSKIRQALR